MKAKDQIKMQLFEKHNNEIQTKDNNRRRKKDADSFLSEQKL